MKLDPRTKIVIVICISTLAVIYNTPGKLLALLVAVLLTGKVLRLKLNFSWGFFWKLAPLFLFLLIIQSIFVRGGEVLLFVGSFPLVTSAGLSQGLSVVLRMIVIISSALFLATSTSREIVLGLVQWKVPYEIAFMFSMALYFLPGFREEFINLVTAVQLRGVAFKRVPWRQKIALCRQLLFPVVYGAVLKAKQMAVAMEARGFRAYPQRTYLSRLQFSGRDYALMVVFPVGTCLLIIGQFICN